MEIPLQVKNNEVKNIPKYFRPSNKRLLLFSFLTIGTYNFYWIYRNWDAVKIFDKNKIHPIVRSILNFIFIYPLFKRIATDLKDQDNDTYRYKLGIGLGVVYSVIWFISIINIILSQNINLKSTFIVTVYIFNIIVLFLFQKLIFNKNNTIPVNNIITKKEAILVIIFTINTLSIIINMVNNGGKIIYNSFNLDKFQSQFEIKRKEYQQYQKEIQLNDELMHPK